MNATLGRGDHWDSEQFHEWVTEAMESAGIANVAQLSREMNSSPPTIHRWLSGEARPKPETLRLMCEVLKQPVLIGYIRAGLLSEAEANLELQKMGLGEYTIPQLADEIKRRHAD
nr:helix-turn-helix transcriptional regulator [Rhodococcus sp. (in: high G+C Gram-positive bacteria)]